MPETVEPDEETDSDERDVISPDDFPTLSLTLEEVRCRYDDEEGRRGIIESKIGIVVTVNALLISFSSVILDAHILLNLLILLPSLISAGLGLYTIRSRNFSRPGKDIDDFYSYCDYESISEQKEQHLLDYIVAIDENKSLNDEKLETFNNCLVLTFISLFLLLFAPLVTQFGYLSSAIEFWQSIISETVLSVPVAQSVCSLSRMSTKI